MKIWGRPSSINVRKVVWAAQETGVAFNRTDAGAAFGVVGTPEYLQMNPNALVPKLQDGDLAAIPHLHRWFDGLRARAASRGVLDQPLT